MKTNETHANMILSMLRAGHKITPLDALDRIGCFRLGARIWELRKLGWNIQKETMTTYAGKSVARYYMDANESTPLGAWRRRT